MAVSLRESVQQVSDPRNLDASVEEVFRLMLGLECERVTATAVFTFGYRNRGGGTRRRAQRCVRLQIGRGDSHEDRGGHDGHGILGH